MKIRFGFTMFFLLVASWLHAQTPIYLDPNAPVEDRVQDLLGRMTLDEKLGQMTQSERGSTSAQDVKDYFLGSVLNGGGSIPGNGAPEDWADMYDAYQTQALQTRLKIPYIYGTDAVHGHNNVKGATIFPHNVGLGAARDPDLIEEIGRVTAKEVALTGLDWTFAPTLCVARDDRWGRAYECFSEDPEIGESYADRFVRGLQGPTGSMQGDYVVATAKHWVGDGGTTYGTGDGGYHIDRGKTQVTEQELNDIHIRPYLPALAEGVGTVMISYSSWNDSKMHGHTYLITDVLKGQLGFNGFTISDWDGINEITPNYSDAVRDSVNAGIDMVMVPNDWKVFISELRNHVNSGAVSMTRINDAVTRILRIKFKAGLFEDSFANRTHIADGTLGSAAHRAVAREAVQKSMVLLKNDNNLLPVAKNANIFVAGSHADNIGLQSGGWTIFWQGGTGAITPGTTILEGIRASTSGNVTYSADGSGAAGHDVAIVVVGEDTYAEGQGDYPEKPITLSSSQLATIQNVKNAGVPVAVVLVTGRPLMIESELANWDAVMAAWLPGTEGNGVADVLVGDYFPTGKLPVTWPRNLSQVPINVGDSNYDPLFAYGFGLAYDGNAPPVTSITSPTATANFPVGNDITITATASDQNGTVAKVEFYDGSTKLGEDLTAPYSFTWTGASEGSHSLTTQATDDLGRVGTSSAISIFVGDNPQQPFSGTPVSFPGTLLAENYDIGGANIAFSDATVGNEGGVYRTDDVDIETSNAGGFNVGWIDAGDWMEYTVNVASDKKYDFEFWVASNGTGGTFHAEINGSIVTGTVTASGTGGWQNFSSVIVKEISLAAGQQVLRFSSDTGGFNLDQIVVTESIIPNVLPEISMTDPVSNATFPAGTTVPMTASATDADGQIVLVEFFYGGSNKIGETTNIGTLFSLDWTSAPSGNHVLTAVATDDKGGQTTSSGVSITVGTPAGQTPFGGVAHALPGSIEAENYDEGGAGVAYSDSDAGNTGSAYRSDDVDIEAASTSGFHVGWTEANEWLEYTVNVAADGNYDLSLEMASEIGGSFHVEIDNVDVSGSVAVAATGGWESWVTSTVSSVALTAGEHVLKVQFDSSGLNFNRLTVSQSSTGTPATSTIQAENFADSSGIVVEAPGIGFFDGGDWMRYNQIDFSTGVNTFTMNMAVDPVYAGKSMELRIDSTTGTLIGTIVFNTTGGWTVFSQQSTGIAGTTGIHDLYLVGVNGGGIGNIDWFTFQ